jgi:Zn-dependent alcohol dehydrogenase
MMVNTEGKPSAVLHSRFDAAETDANGMLQVGKFAARAMVAKGEVSAVIERMSEQVWCFVVCARELRMASAFLQAWSHACVVVKSSHALDAHVMMSPVCYYVG